MGALTVHGNPLPGGVLSARDLVRRIKDISPKGIAPFGLHSVKRMVGRGRKRAVTWEEKPSQEWTDLPLYLKSRDRRALGVDEIADALGTDQADLIEALRTLPLTRERAGGAATVTEETAARHFERMEREAAEAGEAEYRERRGAHPRLADLGITGAHRHRVTTWHIGQDPGDGEWFRPFGRLAVGIAEPGGNPMTHEEIAAVPRGWRVRTVTRDGHRVRLAFPPGPRRTGSGRLVSILHPNPVKPGSYWCPSHGEVRPTSMPKQGRPGKRCPMCFAAVSRANPLDRSETAAVLRTGRAYERDSRAAPAGSRAAGYNLGRSDGLFWTARTFGDARRNSRATPGMCRGCGQPLTGTAREHPSALCLSCYLKATREAQRKRLRNPAYSGYFTGKEGHVTEKYFRAHSLLDAKRQMSAYARAHGLKPSTVWELKSSTTVGRRFAGEWARPLTTGRGKGDDMAKWLDNPRRGRGGRFVSSRGRSSNRRRRRHHRRHTSWFGNPRHHYRSHRRHRRNPDSGIVGAERALSRPADYLTEAALGIAGVYGVVVAGNFVGSTIVPTMYADPSVTGKAVRAGIRFGVGYLADMTIAKNLSPRNRAALRIGGAIGIVGSLALDMLGTTFSLGAGDQSQTFAGILPTGLMAGAGAYMPARRAGVLMGTGAYMPSRRGGVLQGNISGLGDLALNGMGETLMYKSFR